MFNVLFAASEAAPFIQTGGLAEVAGSLPQALAAAGCEVRLVLPAYRSILAQNLSLESLPPITLAAYPVTIGLKRLRLATRLELWLVESAEFFDRPGGPYSDAVDVEWPDNAERFAFFSHAVAALASITTDGWRAQVVHLNDWQTALVPLLLQQSPRPPGTVFTIHNLAYRGLCDFATFARLHLPPAAWHHEGLEFHGQCALIKGGLVYADRLTTVSPTYAEEIRTAAFGCGLEGVLTSRAAVLSGILNGIDYTVWDPAHDLALETPYDAARLGDKTLNKRTLQASFGLPLRDEVLLVGMVTRLAEQKGIDLLLEAIPNLLQHPVQFLFLGNGDPVLEASIRTLAAAHPLHIAYRIGFDVELSHRMFAGLDAFAMPSRFEPCGLSQLYSQRYGTIPIVRRTGGLADSVEDAAHVSGGTGFVFDEPTSLEMSHAIWRAIQVFQDPVRWQGLQRRGMARDFSWTHSARAYLELYRAVAN
jgi:starch synthase